MYNGDEIIGVGGYGGKTCKTRAGVTACEVSAGNLDNEMV